MGLENQKLSLTLRVKSMGSGGWASALHLPGVANPLLPPTGGGTDNAATRPHLD